MPPAHTGELLEAPTVGIALIVTLVVALEEVHPDAVAVTLYVPDMAVVALVRTGFCPAATYPPGPNHK